MAVSCAPKCNVFHESTSRNKKTISNSLAWLKIRGTLSIVVVDNERESV